MNSSPSERLESRTDGSSDARRIALVYAAFAAAWIALAESAVSWMFADPVQRALAAALEGWVFVGVTAALLYGLVWRLVKRKDQAFAQERAVLQEHDRTLRLLQALAQSSPDAIFAKDRDGRYLLFNAEAARVTGHSVEAVLGRNDQSVFPAEQAAMVRANDQRVMAQDRPETFEEDVDTTDGRATFLATKGPLHDAEGRVIGMFGISHDITQRRELERQRQAAQAEAEAARDLLRDVLARVDDGFVALDRDWRYTYLNAQAARMLGREKPEDLLGRHIWTEYPEGVGQPFHRAYEQAMATQKPVLLEDHYKPWDHWFENRIYPSPDGLSIYFTDITQRKRAEQVLRESERDFRLLAEQMPAIIYRATLDTPPTTLYVSPRIAKLGYTPAQWIADAQAWSRTVHPDDRERVVAEAAAGFSTGDEVRLEYRMRDAAGRWRHFRDSARRARAADGTALFVQGVSIDITDHVETEAALREREERLRVSELRYRLAAANGHVWDWDIGGGRFDVAPEAWQQLGIQAPPEGSAYARLKALMHPDDLPRWRHTLREHLARRAPQDIEFRVRHADGEWRWLHGQGQAVWDAAGRATYMAGTVFNITARKRAEEALRAREQRLQLSELRYRLAATHGQVWDWDASAGRTEFAAPFWQQLGFAVPPVNETSAQFEALLHPDDRQLWRDTLREHLAQRAPYRFEFRARQADGEWRWFHTQGQAVWGADGRATYMAGTTFDITQRKRAEQALRESEAYRRSLFEQLGDGVLLIDRDQRILDANPKAHVMLGYRQDELLRLTVRDLLPEFEHARADREVEAVLAGERHLAEWELQRSDGSHFFAEASARLLDDRRFVAVVRDITQRREAERALLIHQLELSELTQRLLSQEKTTTQRVAQALHDHLGQTLAVARLNLDVCISEHAATMPAALMEQGRRIATLLDHAVREVRQVLADLRPPLLEDQGLVAALDNEIRSRTPVGGDVLLETEDAALEQRWPADVEYSAFMVAREAIGNAQQHAGATLIRVLLGGDARRLTLDVLDDGAGIPAPMARGRPGHLGIVGMRERAIAIGAHFSVAAHAAGGTRVMLRWEGREP